MERQKMKRGQGNQERVTARCHSSASETQKKEGRGGGKSREAVNLPGLCSSITRIVNTTAMTSRSRARPSTASGSMDRDSWNANEISFEVHKPFRIFLFWFSPGSRSCLRFMQCRNIHSLRFSCVPICVLGRQSWGNSLPSFVCLT